MKNLLFIGDVVGKAGCDFLMSKLRLIKRQYSIDITVVNGENSAQGNGITRESTDMLISAGADIITTGNHAFRRKEALGIYDEDYMQIILREAASAEEYARLIWEHIRLLL